MAASTVHSISLSTHLFLFLISHPSVVTTRPTGLQSQIRGKYDQTFPLWNVQLISLAVSDDKLKVIRCAKWFRGLRIGNLNTELTPHCRWEGCLRIHQHPLLNLVTHMLTYCIQEEIHSYSVHMHHLVQVHTLPVMTQEAGNENRSKTSDLFPV